MSKNRVVIYLLRRDLRVTDNPILHHLATSSDHGFSHLLPVFVFPAHQMELSGLLAAGAKSPYPEARSRVARFWRCGPHRAKFAAESVWNTKDSLHALGSGLILRAGMFADVVKTLIEGLREKNMTVGAVWMTDDVATEEKKDESDIASVCASHGVEFKTWLDERYFIDDRDLGISAEELPDVFTTYRKSMEPLRTKPRRSLPRPAKGSLPELVDAAVIPAQQAPFVIPEQYEELETALVRPVHPVLGTIAKMPKDATSAHPFRGGEDAAMERMRHLTSSGLVHKYKDTRNGMLGADFSTKLSGYLAHGCITARQIHEALVAYEDGTDDACKQAPGCGEGECAGTQAVRLELLWRDYMRLCTKKFGHRLFRAGGFKDADVAEPGSGSSDGTATRKWKSAESGEAASEVAGVIERFKAGTTGMGLIDASQRELLHTGYTSNRARQNVASFLAKHLGIDWRYGAEWYEMLLVDYDVSSNWANWQYVSGVGNDPRGDDRIFNPVKQAFDYDPEGRYVRTWVPEVARLSKLENVFQAWTASDDDLKEAGLDGNIMVTDPVKRIEFSVNGKPRTARRPFFRRRGQGRAQKGDENGQPTENGASADGHSDQPASPVGASSAPSQARRSAAWRDNGGPHRGNNGSNGYRGGRGGRSGRGTSASRGFGGAWSRGRGGYRGGYGDYAPAMYPPHGPPPYVYLGQPDA